MKQEADFHLNLGCASTPSEKRNKTGEEMHPPQISVHQLIILSSTPHTANLPKMMGDGMNCLPYTVDFHHLHHPENGRPASFPCRTRNAHCVQGECLSCREKMKQIPYHH
eukprot:EG_transcript_33547